MRFRAAMRARLQQMRLRAAMRARLREIRLCIAVTKISVVARGECVRSCDEDAVARKGVRGCYEGSGCAWGRDRDGDERSRVVMRVAATRCVVAREDAGGYAMNSVVARVHACGCEDECGRACACGRPRDDEGGRVETASAAGDAVQWKSLGGRGVAPCDPQGGTFEE